jgi:hypothetical protein
MPRATAPVERTVPARALIVLALLLLAGALRFYHLGTWQYGGDELASLTEERVMFHGASAPHDSGQYRLPHAVPLGYLTIHMSHTLFGDDERGTRVLMAVIGTLSVALVFLLLDGPMSRSTAVLAALLVALMPTHVLFSQFTRFYIVAAFFSFAALGAGARVVADGAKLWAVITCALALLAVLAHAVLLALLPLIAVGVLAGYRARGTPVPRFVWLAFAVTAVLLALLVMLDLWPLLHGWNQGETWGYSPLHAILASIVSIGWSTALLAVVGALLMLRDRSGQGWYWLVCLGGWATVSVAAPLVVIYHPGYAFPYVLAAVVVAAYAIAVIFELLRRQAPLAAYVWGALSCAANVPALASYYVDAGRNDIRGAAVYVRKHWLQGDRVAGYSTGAIGYYDGRCCEPALALPLGPGAVAKLAQLGAANARTWVVLESKRAGLDPQLQAWLFACAEHKLSLGGRRYDDEEFREEVYLVQGPLAGECVQLPAQRSAKSTGSADAE